MKHIHRKKALGLVILAGAIWSILILLTDAGDILNSVKHISTKRMLLVFSLSAANYWLRIVRFHWFSTRVSQRPMKRDLNAIIFFSGLSMNLTPARIGEVVKAYFQHRFFGESFSRMAPIVFFERLTDGLAMLLLMSIGVLTFRIGSGAFSALVAVALLVIAALHNRPLGESLITLARRFPLGTAAAAPLRRALTASYRLTSLTPVLGGTLLGLAAWVLEASGLWLLAGSVGAPMTLSTLYTSWFIFAVSAAFGFLSVIPAGLGINEISTIGLLERLMGINYPDALVMTFAFRVVTLWLGVFLGLVSIIYLERRSEAA